MGETKEELLEELKSIENALFEAKLGGIEGLTQYLEEKVVNSITARKKFI